MAVVPMWNFIAREANWTEIVANTLALGFSLMTILAIAYAVMFNPDILAAVGSVTSGITGVILGYYFNRERLKTAQSQATAAANEQKVVSEQARESEQRMEMLLQAYANVVVQLDQMKSAVDDRKEE